MKTLTIVILVVAVLSIVTIIYWTNTSSRPLSDPGRCPKCRRKGRSMEIFSASKGTETILWQCNYCDDIWTTEHADKP